MTMTNTTRLLVSLIFAGIAVFLVGYTQLPSFDGLRREEAKVTNVIAQPNTWYEVEITTSSGIRITCRTRRGWPLVGPNLCPLEQFENLVGQTVQVLHDTEQPYEVTLGTRLIIDYAAHRKARMIAFVLAGLALAMAILIWRRK